VTRLNNKRFTILLVGAVVGGGKLLLELRHILRELESLGEEVILPRLVLLHKLQIFGKPVFVREDGDAGPLTDPLILFQF